LTGALWFVSSGSDAGETSLCSGFPNVPTTGRLHHGGGVSVPVAPVELPQPPGRQVPAAVTWQRHIFTAAISHARTGAKRSHVANRPQGLHVPAEQLPM